jgi:phosphoglycerate dehydrogenase-like enzyme
VDPVRERLVVFVANVAPHDQERISHGLAHTGARVEFPGVHPPEELVRAADVMVGWRPTPHQLETAEGLRLFVTPAAGVQSLVPVFRALVDEGRSLRLANSHANAPMVAQHAVGLLLALANGIVAHDRWMRAGQWRRGDGHLASVPLRGLMVGLLGYGAINRTVEILLAPFGCRFVKLRSGHSALERRAFFDHAGAIVAALPLTDETRGLVGRTELERLGPSGLLVNVARGLIVDEDALYDALESRRIGGAALDVWYDYDPVPDEAGNRHPYRRPFHELDNVVLSPHRAASPLDSPTRWDDVTSIVARYLGGHHVETVDLKRGY